MSPNPLTGLAEILRQLGQSNPRKRVSTQTRYVRCGKPTCHCAKPGDPGHGPYRYAFWREGRRGGGDGRVHTRYLGKARPKQ